MYVVVPAEFEYNHFIEVPLSGCNLDIRNYLTSNSTFSVGYIGTSCATDFALYGRIEWNITDYCHIEVLQNGF